MPATCTTGDDGMTLGREYMGNETAAGCQPVDAYSRFSAEFYLTKELESAST